MPYCVKCGVELSEGEKSCPLCETPVYNPDNTEIKAEEKKKAIRERAPVRYLVNRYINITGFCIITCLLIVFLTDLSVSGRIGWSRFVISSLIFLWFEMVFPVKYSFRIKTVYIIFICILFAALYLLYLDYLTSYDGWSLYVLYSSLLLSFGFCFPLMAKKRPAKDIISAIAAAAGLYIALLDIKTGFKGWSIYVIGAMALLWAFCLLPFYIKRKYSFIGAMFFDSLLILAYLFFVMSSVGNTAMFFTFALPLVACLAVPVISIYILSRFFKFTVYGTMSLCFLFAGLVSLAVDYIINVNIIKNHIIFREWAIITAIICSLVSPLLFTVEKNGRLRSYLNKKFNY